MFISFFIIESLREVPKPISNMETIDHSYRLTFRSLQSLYQCKAAAALGRAPGRAAAQRSRALQRLQTGARGCCAFSHKRASSPEAAPLSSTNLRWECPLICQHNIFSTRPACNISRPRVAACPCATRLRQIIFVHVTRYSAHLDIFPSRALAGCLGTRASGERRMGTACRIDNSMLRVLYYVFCIALRAS